MTPKLKKIIIIITILVIAFFVYNLFFKKPPEDDVLISGANGLASTRNLAQTQALGNQIAQALIQIESISLDRSIFENKIYKSLIDRSEPIFSEPIGRTNPFAPLSDTSVNVSSGQSSDTNNTEDIEEEDETTEETDSSTPTQQPKPQSQSGTGLPTGLGL